MVCSRQPNRSCSGGWPCSSVVGVWKPFRVSAQTIVGPRTSCSPFWRDWSTHPWCRSRIGMDARAIVCWSRCASTLTPGMRRGRAGGRAPKALRVLSGLCGATTDRFESGWAGPSGRAPRARPGARQPAGRSRLVSCYRRSGNGTPLRSSARCAARRPGPPRFE